MSPTISPYESLLDQCEATLLSSTSDQTLDCCFSTQSVEELVPASSVKPDYRLRSLQDLIDALTLQHLNTNTALENIATLFDNVVSTHKSQFPNLERAKMLFTLLADELRPHMLKEERVLFPFVIRLAKTDEFGLQSLLSPFAGLQNPLRVMTVEHEAASDLFEDLRTAMLNYELPSGACLGHALLCDAVKCLELYLVKHFALEQEVLYPRAIEMETRVNLNG